MEELTAWTEWKERCSLERCEGAARELLASFASVQLHFYVRAYHRRFSMPERPELLRERNDCWHLLERHACCGRMREGKTWKDWLFARLSLADDAPLNTIRSGASLLLRTATRNWLAEDYASANTDSLQRPQGRNPTGAPTLEDLIPAPPSESAEDRELEVLSQQHAAALAEDLNEAECLVLLARRLRLSLGDPRVLRVAGTSRRTLHRTLVRLVERVRDRVENTHEREDREVKLDLAGRIVQELQDEVFWTALEKGRLGHIFSAAGYGPKDRRALLAREERA